MGLLFELVDSCYFVPDGLLSLLDLLCLGLLPLEVLLMLLLDFLDVLEGVLELVLFFFEGTFLLLKHLLLG